jgi:hypothetical protein
MTTLDVNHRRALALLAGVPEGYTTRIMLLHGIGLDVSADLADARLATMEAEQSGRAPDRGDSGAAHRAGRAKLPKACGAPCGRPAVLPGLGPNMSKAGVNNGTARSRLIIRGAPRAQS